MKINKIKKINIAEKINKETGFSLNFSKKLTDDLIKLLIENIKSGYFNIKNIGNFRILKKKSRVGRNPKTKKEYIIEARKVISFIASKNIFKN